jgi:hypothetical protein
MPSVKDDRRHRDPSIDRSDVAPIWAMSLPSTADDTRGSTNLAFRPRAGNISTDTRAGIRG